MVTARGYADTRALALEGLLHLRVARTYESYAASFVLSDMLDSDLGERFAPPPTSAPNLCVIGPVCTESALHSSVRLDDRAPEVRFERAAPVPIYRYRACVGSFKTATLKSAPTGIAARSSLNIAHLLRSVWYQTPIGWSL